jgi:hypothetical protein
VIFGSTFQDFWADFLGRSGNAVILSHEPLDHEERKNRHTDSEQISLHNLLRVIL